MGLYRFSQTLLPITNVFGYKLENDGKIFLLSTTNPQLKSQGNQLDIKASLANL